MMRRISDAGFSLIEVLVTILILVIGLLGLAGLQVRATVSEMESYQRGHALVLLRDMESVVRVARTQDTSVSPPIVASQFSSATWSSTDGNVVFGTGDAYDPATGCAALASPAREVCAWSLELKGAGESRAGAQVGAMLGARGCLIAVNPVSVPNAVAEFYVVVVWQGTSPTADPDPGTPGALCASNINYGSGLRRAVATRVLVPKLTG